jgi:Acetyltransferase (GNAT) domain
MGSRLRLEPVGPEHAPDLWRLHQDEAVAAWPDRVAAARGRLGRDRLEVGWTVRSALWGRGFATEIGRAGLALAFQELGAAQVVAFTEWHNARSRAVMERLDMAYVGEVTAPGLVEGRPGIHDDAPFALYAGP